MRHIFLFEELTGKNKEETKIIYKDKKLICIIPLSQKTSASYGMNTRWCSTTMGGFKMWSSNSILFRFLFKDGTKIRMTYVVSEQKFNWSDKSGNHYFDDRGKDPFKLDMSKYKCEKDEESEWKKKLYSDSQKIFSRVESIPQECKEKVLSYIEECISKNQLPEYDREQSTDYVPYRVRKKSDDLKILKDKFKADIDEYESKGGRISISYWDGSFKFAYSKDFGKNNNYIMTDKEYKSIEDLEKDLTRVLSE